MVSQIPIGSKGTEVGIAEKRHNKPVFFADNRLRRPCDHFYTIINVIWQF